MGADRQLFPAPWQELPNFRIHEWQRHAGVRSVPELAAAVCAHADIRDGDVIVGASLGGMVACEITKLRRIPKIFLIGSAVHPREVNRLAAFAHPLMRVTPMTFVRRLAAGSSRPLAAMFADADPAFVRAMTPAIFRWGGGASPATRVYRIHGRRDPLISNVAEADLWIDARHALSLSHPVECVEFIRRSL